MSDDVIAIWLASTLQCCAINLQPWYVQASGIAQTNGCYIIIAVVFSDNNIRNSVQKYNIYKVNIPAFMCFSDFVFVLFVELTRVDTHTQIKYIHLYKATTGSVQPYAMPNLQFVHWTIFPTTLRHHSVEHHNYCCPSPQANKRPS